MRKLRRALTERETGIKFFRVFSIFFVSTLVWFFVPTPVGLSDQAWHMLIIFVATMIGIMLEVFPLCGFLFVSLLIASMTKTIDLKTQGFSGFSNVVPWLLFLVLALSKSLTNSTIGLRIAC